jgi:hypothetical protein
MEPVSPNGPVGELLGTNDGGRAWQRLASGPPGAVRPGAPALPCLAPIRLVSRTTGLMARCGDGRVFSRRDGGRHWSRAAIRTPNGSFARFDLPRFVGRTGVVAATLGSRAPTEPGRTRAVVFSVSRDGGQDWSVRAIRQIASCALAPYFAAFVAGERRRRASGGSWWADRRPVVQGHERRWAALADGCCTRTTRPAVLGQERQRRRREHCLGRCSRRGLQHRALPDRERRAHLAARDPPARDRPALI